MHAASGTYSAPEMLREIDFVLRLKTRSMASLRVLELDGELVERIDPHIRLLHEEPRSSFKQRPSRTLTGWIMSRHLAKVPSESRPRLLSPLRNFHTIRGRDCALFLKRPLNTSYCQCLRQVPNDRRDIRFYFSAAAL